jgi:hypothetical protein
MALNITSYDPQELKQSLIEHIQTKPEFADFNYEGSTLNTVIDLLVRNTHYIAYMANMVSTESFLDSAQLRANVVSHAQKLSYIPKSRTATTAVVDLEVTPSGATNEISVICEKGSSFINTVGNVSYSFTNLNDVVLYKNETGKFVSTDVELKQGHLLRQRVLYSGTNKVIELLNKDIDTSTLRVFVKTSVNDTTHTEYLKVEDITTVDLNGNIFFISENSTGHYQVEFGKGILGKEPDSGAVVELEYVVPEKEHANGIKSLICASPVSGYSNVTVNVTTEGYGGAERNSIDYIKFLAPKIYEAQNRAVREGDYEALMLREFPFIKSAIAWGGEKNNPPFYGTTFMCAIPQDGFVIADSVKKVIEKRMSEFAVTSITPRMVDAEYLGLRLKVGVLFNADATSNTFEQTSSDIRNVVNQYNDEQLKTFDFWYNNSLLSQKIRERSPAVYSVEIDKEAFYTVDIRTNTKTKYRADLVNEVVEGSIKTSDVIFDINATEQKIYDKGGKLYKSINKNGLAITEEIGTVDYKTGVIDFDAMILNTGKLTISFTPTTDNFYTERNYIVYIDQVYISRLTDRRV